MQRRGLLFGRPVLLVGRVVVCGSCWRMQRCWKNRGRSGLVVRGRFWRVRVWREDCWCVFVRSRRLVVAVVS